MRSAVLLLVAAAALAGCSGFGGFGGGSGRQGRQSTPLDDSAQGPAVINAGDSIGVYLQTLRSLIEGDPVVQADVFLLTDRRPTLHADRDDFALLRSETASTLLLDDLRSDKGMKWVPDDMWLTYLRIDATARDLEGDLVVSGSTPESTWARLVGSTR